MDGNRDQGVKEVKEVKNAWFFHSTYAYREKAANGFTSLTWFTGIRLPESPSPSTPMIAKTKIGHSSGTAMAKSNGSKRSQNGTVDNRTNVPTVSRLLTLNLAAVYMSLSYDSLYRMYVDGEVPHVRFGRKVLIDRQDLDDWIEKHKEIGVF